jgi:serine/threonine-protein kinase
LRRPVAVKLLRLDLADQPKARRRFETEAQAAARLVHPNVVTVFDSGEENGVPFLVMERLPGRTLADEFMAGLLALPRVREVAREILSALEAAHRAGIVHRDIKPGNVLLTDDGHVKVGDFGIAKTVDDIDQTQTLELIATLSYLAPERLAGEPASARSDLYSVGVLLYEAISGRRPFTEASPAAEMVAIERGDPAPVASLRSPLPDDLARVVERSMSRDPADRYSSAAEMAAALGGRPAAQPETVPIEAGAVAPTMLVDVAPEGDTQLLVRAEPQRPEPVVAQKRSRRTLAIGATVALLAVLVAGAVIAIGHHDDHRASVPRVTTTVTSAPQGAKPLPAPLDAALRRLEQDVGH